jgi:uncharacterized membrane protein YfcA
LAAKEVLTGFDIEVAFIMFVSAFTMSFAGFGFAMISVPLLSFFFPVETSVVLQFPFCMGLFMYQAWHYRSHFSWQPMRPMMAGTIIGIILGTFFLYHLPDVFLKRALSVFIITVVLYNAAAGRWEFSLKQLESPWFGRICGLFSGSFMGAFNIGGPAAILYFRTVTGSSLKAKSLIASFFSIMYVLLIFLYGMAGFFSLEIFRASLIYTPAVIAGSIAGFKAFHYTSNSLYNRLVDVALLVISLVMWAGV